jgi:hypothetical protein
VCNPAVVQAAEELHARSKGYLTSVYPTSVQGARAREIDKREREREIQRERERDTKRKRDTERKRERERGGVGREGGREGEVY